MAQSTEILKSPSPVAHFLEELLQFLEFYVKTWNRPPQNVFTTCVLYFISIEVTAQTKFNYLYEA